MADTAAGAATRVGMGMLAGSTGASVTAVSRLDGMHSQSDSHSRGRNRSSLRHRTSTDCTSPGS